jgi:hypothetical protein
VLAVVLVVDDSLDAWLEPARRSAALGRAGRLRAIGILAPVEEGLGEVGRLSPDAESIRACSPAP